MKYNYCFLQHKQILINHSFMVLPFFFPEFKLLNFPGCSLRQLAKFNMFWRLKSCKVFFAKCNDFFGFWLYTIFWYYKRFRDLSPFFNDVRRIGSRSDRAATFYIQRSGRALLQALAFHTPIASSGGGRNKSTGRFTSGFRARGRARAGWWPAAAKLGVSSIYSPAPNLGEGDAIDNSLSRDPSITLINHSTVEH